jgi:hypothetical protein
MQAVRTIVGVLGCLWLIFMLVFGAGSSWLIGNSDKIDEAIEGVTSTKKKQCELMHEEYQDAWNRAVDSGNFNRHEDDLKRMKRAVEISCPDE